MFNRTGEKNIVVKYIITPGGFLGFKAKNIKNMTAGWSANQKHVAACASEAAKMILSLMNREMINISKNITSYITLGIDSHNDIDANHIELIFVYDIKNKRIDGYTGKSYPTIEQERRLLRISKTKSHFFKHGSDRVVVLGCHDLNIFSSRVESKISRGTERFKIVKEFIKTTKKFAPNIVLHHPHLTDSSRIWSQGWSGVKKNLGSKIVYASALRMKRTGNRAPNKINIMKATTSHLNPAIDIIC